MAVLRTSSVPAVLDALNTLFTTALTGQGDAGSNITVYWGDPGPQTDRECVIIGDTSSPASPTEQTWAAIGARKRDEKYDLGVHTFVNKPGLTAREAAVRGYAIVALLETALRVDVTLGLPQAGTLEFIEIQVAQVSLQTWPAQEGFVAYLPWALRVHTRI